MLQGFNSLLLRPVNIYKNLSGTVRYYLNQLYRVRSPSRVDVGILGTARVAIHWKQRSLSMVAAITSMRGGRGGLIEPVCFADLYAGQPHIGNHGKFVFRFLQAFSTPL